ncbi:hypothetical protein [Haloflavibacter putidus]|uniref:Uncharacterized protein n=1 Tax=Haloflavibacter putidus TaxID=2576776 RepID=A0A507ZPU7_9FLAO|nr:hypothetical protein [Haloflavibacter putidus]TQD39600.1 hypothetical protein FKR84_03645 [Haloflavibacter putidus]
MRTSYQSTTILREMNNLITYSCNNQNISTERFSTFHKALLKKHFEASEVSIDIKENTLHLQILVESNKHVNVNFEYQSLEALLKSCLEKDNGSLGFYQNMLTFYNVASV